MSSVHKEAWEGLRDELIKNPEEEYDGIEIVGMMSHYLDTARKRAKEYQKRQKELELSTEEVEKIFDTRWKENKEV